MEAPAIPEQATEMELLRKVIQEVAAQSQRDIDGLRQEVHGAVGQAQRDLKTARLEAKSIRQEMQRGLPAADVLRQEIREQTQRDFETLRQDLLGTLQRDMRVFRQESRRLRQEAQSVANLRQEWEEVRGNLCTLSDRLKAVAEHANVRAGVHKSVSAGVAGRRKIRDTCWGISLPLAMTLCAVFGFGIGVTLS
ncbi:NADH dehydrogenase [ubiquinone] 1 beta subcomplex subunit 9 isoform X1 [Stigmatopora nigra]